MKQFLQRIPDELLERLDIERGLIPRNPFVNKIIEEYLEEVESDDIVLTI